MMFSKVEAGKAVADTVIKLQKSSNEVKILEKSPISRLTQGGGVAGLTEEEEQRAKELEDRIRLRRNRLKEEIEEEAEAAAAINEVKKTRIARL